MILPFEVATQCVVDLATVELPEPCAKRMARGLIKCLLNASSCSLSLLQPSVAQLRLQIVCTFECFGWALLPVSTFWYIWNEGSMLIHAINSNIPLIFTLFRILSVLPGVCHVSYMLKLLDSVLYVAMDTMVHQDKPRNPFTLYNLRILWFWVCNTCCAVNSRGYKGFT